MGRCILPMVVAACCIHKSSAIAQVHNGEWLMARDGSPGLRTGASLVYDSAREVTILFGGWSGEPTSDTWEWNGVAWRQVESRPYPASRYDTAIVYDSRRGVCVLYGGYDAYNSLIRYDDTWEYDGHDWTRRLITGPGPRSAHAMAYDSARGVTVLTGGQGPGGALGDTWEYDGNEWRLAETQGFGLRTAHAMTYDDRRSVCVLFSGLAQAGGLDWLPDTWEWNGETWRLVADSGPPGRGTDMVFDTTRGVSVLYGGFNGHRLGDMWGWDGVRWQSNDAREPGARSSPLAYDSARGVIVLYGGTSSGPLGDMWEYRAGITLFAVTSCPQSGPALLQWKRGTPNGFGSLVYGSSAEPFHIPNHLPCPGTALLIGHRDRQIVATASLGPDGRRSIFGNLNYNACGGVIQAIDQTTCQTSNLIYIE